MTNDDNTVIKIRDVSKSFSLKKKEPLIALTEISLDIKTGEFVSLLGPSGCGKSTLMRLVGDLILPSGGIITLKGKTPHQARLDRDYGIVFQAPVLMEWRTVFNNVN